MVPDVDPSFFEEWPVMRKWLAGGAVSTSALRDELQQALQSQSEILGDPWIEAETWAEGLTPAQLEERQQPYRDPPTMRFMPVDPERRRYPANGGTDGRWDVV